VDTKLHRTLSIDAFWSGKGRMLQFLGVKRLKVKVPCSGGEACMQSLTPCTSLSAVF